MRNDTFERTVEKRFLQLSVDVVRENSSQVIEALEDLGAMSISVLSANDEEAYDQAHAETEPCAPQWQQQSLIALFGSETSPDDLSESLADCFSDLVIESSYLADRDWERVSRDQFKPLRISSDFWIVPSWATSPVPDAVNLTIDPGLAFGTGTHPTTRMCLEYISASEIEGMKVLDYGCGSGILSLAALKFGAFRAIATDVDPKALSTCLENARINSCSDRLVVVPPEELEERTDLHSFDLVIANILAPILISLRDRLSDFLARNGTLLLSGILPGQSDDLIHAYGEKVEFTARQESDWVLLIGKKKSME